MEVNEISNLSLFTLNVNSTSNVEVEKAERVEETTLHLEKTLAINQFAVQVHQPLFEIVKSVFFAM